MPIILKPAALKIKNEQGQYTSHNILADEAVQEYLQDIQDKGNAVLDSIPDEYYDLSNHVDILDVESYNYVDSGYVEDGVAYFTHGDNILFEITGIGGGGGGGGGGGNNAKLTVTNTSGFNSKTISTGDDCVLGFTWSSIEDEQPTGDGTLTVTSNGALKLTQNIQQGGVQVNVGPFLSSGNNTVKVQVTDIYGNSRVIAFTIISVELSISSTFDTSTPFSGDITFTYTPVGATTKTVHFVLDGTQIGTQRIDISGRQLSYTIPAQTHDTHTFECYLTATINGSTVTSNQLYYEFMSIVPGVNRVLISSSFHQSTVDQYDSVLIPYYVYDPNNLTADITISVGQTVISTQTVDRTQHSYTFRADESGQTSLIIACGNVSKVITFTVEGSSADIEAETQDLVLYLSSQGKSNNDTVNREKWEYGTGADKIECTLTDFNFTSDGWVNDEDGITVLRCSGDARVTIPYKPFARDFRTTGKTIEIEFATRNVIDYSAVIMSCMSGGRGFELTSQSAALQSEQSRISTQYKEDEHIRIAFVAQKRAENRLLYVFINGIPSGVVQYADNDDFSQSTPVDITIGSNDCGIDVYCIRIYDNNLTDHQVLNNWIADTQVGTTKRERYLRNDIYDAYGNVIISKLPTNLPYFILNAQQLPQYKGDKKTISGSYVDPSSPSKSFTFTGCQINVQGTSSAVYVRKNYDMQFKNGFEMTSTGEHADSYALRSGAIPFNRFVLKADVASSEGANNVELVRLYNDTCPYKTPEMQADSKVRWGIDGFPIVVFWNNTTTGTTSFLGKYNFNLPKRAPGPYGYQGDDESWEFQNNTSNLMLFLSDYFDNSIYTDPETGDTKERWRFDYEARFPSDEWINYNKLQILQSFIYSTYRAGATGNNLSSPVTYPGTRTEYIPVEDPTTHEISYEERVYRIDVTYDKDTADYRLAKFKAEFGNYAELNSFIFYYIFTELFLMVDSRAKNLFIGFHGGPSSVSGLGRKAVAEPYDMDTAIGTNNEGTLVFNYGLEDTDLQAGKIIFNGQNSVLWCNLRDAFSTEIRQMYQQLRAAGLNYSLIESRYEDHQEKWPEAIWVEDSRFKYIDPLTNPEPGKQPTADYLSMLQGSKEEQRKWWLYNRFKYMDSKWNAGDALSQVIILRAYEKADITVTPYTDIYPTIKYASYVVQERGQAGVPSLLRCPIDTLSDTEISIYSAPQLSSVGDLSPLEIGFANFSEAVRIQEIKIGDADNEYDNQNLYNLTLGNNVLLKKLDVRNCSGLGNTQMAGHTQTTVDLSNCAILEEVYFEGTNIKGLTLPRDGVLKKIHLPNTITNLTIINQPLINDFSVTGNDYSGITTLRIENCSSVIPVLDILSDLPAQSRVRLIGFTTTASTTTDVEDFYDYLDTMAGLDEQGIKTDTAQVQGTITGLDTITGAWLAQMKARYPYIDITYNHITSNLYYYNGSTLLYTEPIADGGNGVYAGTPTKAQDAQYSYTFAGWSKDDDNTVDADARNNVIADRNVYACYTNTLRTYTVLWKNSNGTTLETDNNVPYGTTPTYNGSTPVDPSGNSSPFVTWTPTVAAITGATTYTATYKPVWTVTFKNQAGTSTLQTKSVIDGNTATYTGTTPTNTDGTDFLGWADSTNASVADANILKNIKANKTVYAAHVALVEDVEITDTWDQIIQHIDAGDYKTRYKLGNYKPLDLGSTYGTVNMQIVAIDGDELASGGTAPLTFLAKELLLQTSKMNSTNTNANGYPATNVMKPLLDNTIYPLILSNIKERIQRVNKTYYDHTTTTTLTSVEKLWIPSLREISNSTGYEDNGVKYNIIYGLMNNTRIKKSNGSAISWWTRSARSDNNNFYGITTSGGLTQSQCGYPTTLYGVCIGFCLGLEQETITDSWDTILSNANYATDYSVGDTKSITVNGENHFMEIVALNTDTKSAGGTAGITWLMKDQLNTTHGMNATGTNANGWPATTMRSWLRDTILPTIDSTIRNGIVEVNKTYYNYTTKSTLTQSDTIWIPSAREMFGGTSYESSGVDYTAKFNSTTARIKKRNGTAQYYWLRSASSSNSQHFYYMLSSGISDVSYSSAAHGVVLGFCTN